MAKNQILASKKVLQADAFNNNKYIPYGNKMKNNYQNKK